MNKTDGSLCANIGDEPVVEKISKFTVSPANHAVGGGVPGNGSMTGAGMSHNNQLCDINEAEWAGSDDDHGVYRGKSMSHNTRASCPRDGRPPLSSPRAAANTLTQCAENSQQNARIQPGRGGRLA